MNQFNVIGNMGKDPELKYSQGGNAYCRFSVATKSGWGEREKTVWVNCVAFGKKGEAIEKFFHRGSKIALTGEITTDEYEKDGTTYRTWELVVRDFFFCERSGSGTGQSQTTQTTQTQPAFDDEDIPF